MWALLNAQDPNFKNLSKQEQDQKVLAEIQKRKDEYAQIQKAPSPAAEQNKIYDKTLTDLEKDRFGRRLNTEQRENYASFIVNKDRYMQQGYDFAQDPMIKDREKELKIEGNIITLTNPNNLVNYIPNKDYVLPSGNKNTPPRIYRFDGQKFILNNNPASFRNQQSSKQVIQ
jgi:hypothetical protein